MNSNLVSRFVKVVVINETNGSTLKGITNDDKSLLNGHNILELNLTENANVDAILQAPRVSLSSLISLNLSQCNLNSIPDAFKDLTINELNLSHNSLNKVPGCIIDGLKSLQVIDVSHNQLTYFQEPTCVKKLRILHVNNNKLINIPEWVLKLHAFNLEELNYSFNDLTSLEESRFHQVPTYELKNLIIKNCSIRNSDVVHLKNIKSLRFLDLSNENDNKLFNSITNCDELLNKPRWDDRLKILCLNYLGISDLPNEIALLVSLEELFVSKNELLWLPESIVTLQNLRLLDLSFNKLVCLPQHFYKIQALQILILAHNSLSSFIYSYPPNLKKLDLYDNLLESYNDMCLGDIQIDLEMNYIDTLILNEKYQSLKKSLRVNLNEIRCDGSKELVNEYSESESSASTAYSSTEEKECINKTYEDKFEEYWSSDGTVDLCKNGCTLSDNEWTGCEEKSNVNVKKKVVRRYPSWIFQDVDVIN